MKKRYEKLITTSIDVVANSVNEELKNTVKIPIFMISHKDVEEFEHDEPYCLYILGNEEHKSFDFKFSDKNCRTIIKPYPHIKNYSPSFVLNYQLDDIGRYFIETDREDERVLNLPLGPTVNFSHENVEKNINFGFFGQSSGIRSQVVGMFPKNLLTNNIYSGFGINRSGSEYSEFLSRCEISLCPTGHSPETYRLYESAAAGCALIGTALPKTEYYFECPIFSLPWQAFTEQNKENIFEILEKILKNKEFFQNQSKKWAEKWTNPKFLSEISKKHIENFA
jgi:hypothetical protein